MNRLFVDTSAWAAIADTSDDQHQAALAYQAEIAGRYRLVITNYILDELYTLLLMNVGYTQTIHFKRRLDQLIQGGFVEIVWISESVAHLAWQVFEQFNVDKLWSFTDCVSYVVMQSHGITEVFSFDHHFSQMNFIRHP
jgi:predicted nucleic acid-binding protein